MSRRRDGESRVADASVEIDVLLDELDEAFGEDLPTRQANRGRRESSVRPSSQPAEAKRRTPPPPPSASWQPAPTPQVSQPAVVAMLEMENLREENTRLWELVRLVREVRRLEDLFERRGGRQNDHRAFVQARNQLDAALLSLLGG